MAVPALATAPSTDLAPAPDRKLELDWIRILVVAAVFVFHTGRFFDPEGWHVKNAQLYPWLSPVIMTFAAFGMPLLFAISGAGTRLGLGGHGACAYLRGRAHRLLVPLAVGIFTHVMFQVWLERRTHGDFQGSFFEFVPRYFDGFYGFGGNFAWMGLHLWYLEMLFVFSVVFLPLFLWFRTAAGARALERLCAFLARGARVYVLGVFFVLAAVLPPPQTLVGSRGWGGWNVLGHACFFLTGYLVASSEVLYAAVRRHWSISSALLPLAGIPTLIGGLRGVEPEYLSLGSWLLLGGLGLTSFLGVLTLLGAAIAGLRRPSPLLRRLNEGVLPFYVLHQSVILAVGWRVVPLGIPDVVKWLVIAVASLAITLGIYELLVRPFRPMRFLFGMKTR